MLNEGLEKKVEKRTKSLAKARDKAEESDRLKSAFLSNMSHEIRTPMNSIIGFSDLLGEDDLENETRKRYINIIQRNSDQLLNLIDDIIDIAKIEADQIELRKTKDGLHSLMEELYNTFIIQTNHRLDFNLTNPEQDITINTDHNRLKQVLKNLLNNAFKFTEEGNIEFGYSAKGDLIHFFVKDTGVGISEQSLPYIFKRFRRESTTHTKIYDGTGLGLSISENLVKLLGGELTVESKLKKGSTFKFTIPFV